MLAFSKLKCDNEFNQLSNHQEPSMKPEQKPTKEVVRTWLHDRVKAKTPPPEREEIRRQLGWPMNNTKRECAR